MTDMMASEGRRSDGCECVYCFEASAGGGRVGRRRGGEVERRRSRRRGGGAPPDFGGSEEDLRGAPAETLHFNLAMHLGINGP